MGVNRKQINISLWLENLQSQTTLLRGEILLSTVRLGKMAQHARLWALFMAKLKGQSQNASNMALGECIGLQHIQI